MFIIISIREGWDIEICWLNREDNKIAIKHHRTFLFEKKTELNKQNEQKTLLLYKTL